MRILFLILVFFSIALNKAYSQKYVFIGVYQQKEAGKGYCQDKVMEQQALFNKTSYDSIRTAFRHKYGKEAFSTTLLGPDRAALVYEFLKPAPGWNCNYKAIGIAFGATLEDAQSSLDKQIADSPKSYASSPNIIFRWKGNGESRQVKEVNYNGVKVKYTIIKSEAGKTYVMGQFKNTSAKEAANLTFIANNKIQFKEKLDPGGSLNRKIDFTDFNIEVEYEPFKPESPGMIDRVKQVIKDHITIKEDKITTMGSVGVRG